MSEEVSSRRRHPTLIRTVSAHQLELSLTQFKLIMF